MNINMGLSRLEAVTLRQAKRHAVILASSFLSRCIALRCGTDGGQQIIIHSHVKLKAQAHHESNQVLSRDDGLCLAVFDTTSAVIQPRLRHHLM